MEDRQDRPSSLHVQVARGLIAWIRSRRLKSGYHLREEEVAQHFGLSRSPVRGAFRVLADLRLLQHESNRGYYLRIDSDDAAFAADNVVDAQDDALYNQIARAWFAGELPEYSGEAVLRRQFAPQSRTVLARALRQLTADGIISPVPGKGWRLEPNLGTASAFEDSYQYRQTIEPAAILLDSFTLDGDEARIIRQRHRDILDGDRAHQTLKMLVDADIQFHEFIGRCSGNRFFASAIDRQNALRRLTEHLANLESGRLYVSCEEHLLILDALESGDRCRAAERMREHLTISSDHRPAYSD